MTNLLPSKYILAIALFVVWMTFIDQNNWIDQYQLSKVIAGLEIDLDRYDTELADLKVQHKAMLDERERFARETFYLHRKDEVVFVIDR